MKMQGCFLTTGAARKKEGNVQKRFRKLAQACGLYHT